MQELEIQVSTEQSSEKCFQNKIWNIQGKSLNVPHFSCTVLYTLLNHFYPCIIYFIEQNPLTTIFLL